MIPSSIATKTAAYAATAALILALAGAGVLTLRLVATRDELGTERLARAKEARDHEAAARLAGERYRALEADMNHRLKEAQDAAVPKRAAAARVAAADAVVLGGLRVDLDAFATGGGDAAGDTLPACRARAADLGRAVEDGMRVQAGMAAAFATLAVDYGVLYAGWPGAGGERRDAPVTMTDQ